MKSLFFTLALVTTNAFALDVCSFNSLYDLEDAMAKQRMFPVKTVKKNYSANERKLIHRTVALHKWVNKVSENVAVQVFRDVYDGGSGALEGNIKYFHIKGGLYAFARYNPGDNDYGAIFRVMGDGSFPLIANIRDAEIICK